ncbi:MAG: ATP-grasp domain-containing protein [Bacteroidetes bacterium]|nr:ATP-grasp domain-containing protein [Bacteroidota bacterium]
MKKAIVLGGASSHISLLSNLRERGYVTQLVDIHPNPVARDFADVHHQISAMDVDAIQKLAIMERADLVISASGDQLNLVACRIAQKMGLPAPYNVETALLVTDKALMKNRMVEARVPTPAFIVAPFGRDIVLGGLKLPLIVKPADSYGSKGVRVAYSLRQLEDYIEYARTLSSLRKVIIEEFIEGREIVIDAFVAEGVIQIISIYEKYNIYSNQTVVQCFRSLRPLALEESMVDNLHDIAQNLVNAFGLQNTTLFIQTIVKNKEIFVIEFGARAAGGLASRATQLSTGFDAIDATINTYLGINTAVNLNPNPDYISTNSIYSLPDVFDKVKGQEELLDKKIIEELVIYKSPGMRISPYMTSADRVAGFIVKATNKEDLSDKTTLAINHLQIMNDKGQDIMIRDLFNGINDSHIVLPH